MCIRDRGYTREELLDMNMIELYEDPNKRNLILEAVKEHGDCLLYTSDAADERSSVDLGGRRIIKKKKNKKNIQHTSILRKYISDTHRKRTQIKTK